MLYKAFLTSVLEVLFCFALSADEAGILPHAIEKIDETIPIFVWVDAIEVQSVEDAASTLIHLDRVTKGRITELIWWKSRRERVRKLAVFLMTRSVTDAVVGDTLRGELLESAARFSENERKAREAEIDWVWGRFSQLSKDWDELEENTDAQ
jgi:hypothetical protein